MTRKGILDIFYKNRVLYDKMKKYFIFIVFIISLLVPISSAMSAIELKYEGWEMTAKARISQQYTDNLTFAKEKEDRVEKFMTTFSVGIDVDYTGRRRSFGLRGNITRWLDNDNFDAIRKAENLRLTFSHEFSEYDRISLDDSFHHSRFPVDFEEEFGRYTVDQDTYSNRFNLGYSREISEHLNIRIDYNNSVYWASKELSRDSVANGVGLQVNYIYSVATSASLSYRYSTRRFKDRGTSTVNSVSAGLKKYITKRLYVNGRVGFSVVSPVEGNDSVTGTYNISLTDEIDERTVVRLSFSRDVHTTREADVFTNWQVRASLERDMMDNLKGSISGFYGEGEFNLIDVRDNFFGANTKLDYIFGKHLTGNLGYTYSKLDSTDKDREYTRNTISAGLTLTF